MMSLLTIVALLAIFAVQIHITRKRAQLLSRWEAEAGAASETLTEDGSKVYVSDEMVVEKKTT